jgi:hypothetical protein
VNTAPCGSRISAVRVQRGDPGADIVEAMTALHVFDMDGTLLRGTTAAIEISRRVGRLQPLAELERRFAGEEISAPDFAVETHALWEDLREAYAHGRALLDAASASEGHGDDDDDDR